MEYTISRNPEFNSLEITFDGKPAEAVRAALKALRFRWHSVKKCWYGYTTEEEARAAIDGAAPCETVCEALPESKTINEGTLYEGFQGGNNHRWHSVEELKKCLSADFKRAGIKATIRQNRAGYLTSITVTIKGKPADVLTFEEWQGGDKYKGLSGGWTQINYTDEAGTVRNILKDEVYGMDQSTPEFSALLDNINRTAYRLAVERLHGTGYNFTYYSDILKPGLLAQIETVKAIVSSYNRDESNSQIDYFSRDIYDNYSVKIA